MPPGLTSKNGREFMRSHKREIIAALAAASIALACAGSAVASPTAVTSLVIEPHSEIYREVPRPVSIRTTTDVTPESGALTLKPMVNVKSNFPEGLTFVPDESRTPVCPLSKVGPDNANFPTDTAMELCGSSLVGNGTSDLFLAQSVNNKITDAKLLAFNAGIDDQGRPIVNIHGYSAATNFGVFMTGTLIDGVLDVKIPRLTADTSVPAYKLDFPGTLGRDPDYARASCPTGDWSSNAVITLAKRNEAGAFSESEDLTSPVTHVACSGIAGSAKFARLKLKGPRKVKSGKKGTFKVTVSNTGTASSKKGKITASGAGKGSATLPAVKPGASKTITVKAKVKGKKGKKVTVKFKAAGGVSASAGFKFTVG